MKAYPLYTNGSERLYVVTFEEVQKKAASAECDINEALQRVRAAYGRCVVTGTDLPESTIQAAFNVFGQDLVTSAKSYSKEWIANKDNAETALKEQLEALGLIAML